MINTRFPAAAYLTASWLDHKVHGFTNITHRERKHTRSDGKYNYAHYLDKGASSVCSCIYVCVYYQPHSALLGNYYAILHWSCQATSPAPGQQQYCQQQGWTMSHIGFQQILLRRNIAKLALKYQDYQTESRFNLMLNFHFDPSLMCLLCLNYV